MAKVNGIVTSKEFDAECVLINARREYPGDNSLPQFFIATDLDEAQLAKRYQVELSLIKDYMIVPMYYANVRKDYNANENKHAMRRVCNELNLFNRGNDQAALEELQSLSSYAAEKCKDILESLCEAETECEEHRKLKAALNRLTHQQRERLTEYAVTGATFVQLAKKYGVNPSSISRAFAVAEKKIRDIWDEL